uniref:Reelin domain-containing protein n=1 Tax=Romanomermis culicivorax TaxID=13658 RepID=A0A915ISG6_ROMCU
MNGNPSGSPFDGHPAYNLVVKLTKLDFYAHGSSTSTFNHHDDDGQSYVVVCYAKKSANGSLYGFYLQFSTDDHLRKLNASRSPKCQPRFVNASVSMNIPELKISSERKNVTVLTNEYRGTVFLKWIPKDRLIDLEYVKVNINLKLSSDGELPTNVCCAATGKNAQFCQSKSDESIIIENNCDEQDVITLISNDRKKAKS